MQCNSFQQESLLFTTAAQADGMLQISTMAACAHQVIDCYQLDAASG